MVSGNLSSNEITQSTQLIVQWPLTKSHEVDSHIPFAFLAQYDRVIFFGLACYSPLHGTVQPNTDYSKAGLPSHRTDAQQYPTKLLSEPNYHVHDNMQSHEPQNQMMMCNTTLLLLTTA